MGAVVFIIAAIICNTLPRQIAGVSWETFILFDAASFAILTAAFLFLNLKLYQRAIVELTLFLTFFNFIDELSGQAETVGQWEYWIDSMAAIIVLIVWLIRWKKPKLEL